MAFESMSFFESLLTYKAMKELAKKLLTLNNAKWVVRQYNKYITSQAEHFASYKEKMLTQFEFVNNSLLGNDQKRLNEIFVTQYLQEENGDGEVVIDGYPVETIRRYRRIIIKDYAGRGKSTLMRQMFIGACNMGLFPLFIQLRDLNDGDSLMSAILRSLGELNQKFDENLLKYLIRHDDFIFFLDGFDEVRVEKRGEVAKMIREMVVNSSRSCFILTSRNDSALSSFNNFKGFMVKDFSLQQACELILKIDNSAKGRDLVKELQDGKHSEVSEFLKSPLQERICQNYWRRPVIIVPTWNSRTLT